MQLNVYSRATMQAELTKEQIRARWGSGDFCLFRINLINEAFRLYYVYRKRIEQVSAQDYATYWAMLDQLEDAATSGWGISGVDDLDDAFEHLIANHGCWTDEKTLHYWGSKLPSVYNWTVFNAPAAGANFLAALNDKLRELAQLTVQFQLEARSARAPEAKMRKLGELGRKIVALAWLLPVPPAQARQEPASLYEELVGACDAFNRAIQHMDAAGIELRTWIKELARVTDWLTRADQAAQAMVAARRAGLPQHLAYAWGALTAAVSAVPVLGDFYGQVVAGAPGLMEWMQRTVEQHHRRLELAAAGRL
ncbi:MAG: hypothetical protein RMI94_05365 [Bryobacterales bacterium]|nr:hypothetical protein [Bryobacteraceae bacterium]MDW8129958.1 hypothetical protein [Bryobacterales bacterium]